MTTDRPVIVAGTAPFVAVSGMFYRAVAPDDDAALRGSTGAGRFARDTQTMLYLNASIDGVAAAMWRYGGTGARRIVRVWIDSPRVCDVRDAASCVLAGIDPAEAAADWQAALATGREPPSWRVADRLRDIDATGIIDPSRTAPGRWHLALFSWEGAWIG